MSDPFETLGVDRNASEEEIKKAYRKQAMNFHPDRNPGDKEAEDKFKKVQEAYDTITNKKPQTANPFNVDDIFNSFFNMHGFKQQQRRGRDIHAYCEIDFLEAANGCDVTVNMRRGDTCPSCKGEGATDIKACSVCLGTGAMTYRQGNVSIRTTCNSCGGKGNVTNNQCPECVGDGIVKDTVPISIKIPQGIRDGDRIKLPNQGEQLSSPGDAYIAVRVHQHELFRRNGDDLTFNVPITFGQAVFGDTIKVPTLEGIIDIQIKPEVKNGHEIRVPHKGLMNTQTGRRGDCVIILEIDTSMPVDDKVRKQIIKLMKIDKFSQLRNKFNELAKLN